MIGFVSQILKLKLPAIVLTSLEADSRTHIPISTFDKGYSSVHTMQQCSLVF